ncbi:MAG: hypothetical protein LBM75_03635 [Myxococcales bacterium]|nr:hypothetical protein [Myxococcales bacterium]
MSAPYKIALPFFLATLLAVCAACTGLFGRTEDPAIEKLFFALRIETEGQLVAKPHLLGETDHRLSMKLVDPVAPEHTRLAVELLPTRLGNDYSIQFGLLLSGVSKAPQVTELTLAHGQERKFQLLDGSAPLTVTLMLMRVDSPEFDAWLELVRKEQEKMST